MGCVRIWQTALTRLIESLSETDAGEAEKLTSLLRGADKEHPSAGNRASMEIQEGTAAARQRATSKRSSGSGAKKKAHNAGAHILEEGIGKGTHTGRKYRKDSVDRESIRTREKYQRTQADRVRTCYKEGKAQVRLLSSRDLVTTSNITWEVPCALKFYQDAYGVIPGNSQVYMLYEYQSTHKSTNADAHAPARLHAFASPRRRMLARCHGLFWHHR